MRGNKITVSLRLGKEDIELLASEMESCESSHLTEFISTVLMAANHTARQLEETAADIQRANPFSKQNKKA